MLFRVNSGRRVRSDKLYVAGELVELDELTGSSLVKRGYLSPAPTEDIPTEALIKASVGIEVTQTESQTLTVKEVVEAATAQATEENLPEQIQAEPTQEEFVQAAAEELAIEFTSAQLEEEAQGVEREFHPFDQSGASGKIDLNSATLEDLLTLPVVGPVSAKAIIAGRPYSTFEGVPEKAGLTGSTRNRWKELSNYVYCSQVPE